MPTIMLTPVITDALAAYYRATDETEKAALARKIADRMIAATLGLPEMKRDYEGLQIVNRIQIGGR
jgi:hypothetical protein